MPGFRAPGRVGAPLARGGVPLRAARAASRPPAARQVSAYAEALHYAATSLRTLRAGARRGRAAAELRQARLALAEAALTCGDYTAAESTFGSC